MLGKIKNFLRNNRITAKPYAFLGKARNRYIISKMRKEIQKNGVKTIHHIQALLEKTGLPFFFDMGTLLGIVREGRLLGHDLDIDVAVYASGFDSVKHVEEILVSNGCLHKYRYEVADIGVVEDSFFIDGIKFDVNYYRRDGEDDVCYLCYSHPEKTYEPFLMDTVELRCRHIDQLVKTSFGGVMINVPDKAEGYLAQRYGANWRIPDKNYIYWKGPSTSPIPNVSRRTVY